MVHRSQRLTRESNVRQDSVLVEAADRVRRFAGLGQTEKHLRPLVVVVTKYDAWSHLIGPQRIDLPVCAGPQGQSLCAVRVGEVEALSQRVRSLLLRLAPEVVSAAENFAEEVIYIPVSAMGGSPEIDSETGFWGIRPKNINPMWAEVPLLYALSRWMKGIVPYTTQKPAFEPADPSDEKSLASQIRQAWPLARERT